METYANKVNRRFEKNRIDEICLSKKLRRGRKHCGSGPRRECRNFLALDSAPGAAQETAAVSIVRAPTDLPAPLGRREPATVRVELEAIELVGALVDGTSYRYWSERPARTPEGGQSLDDAPSK